MSSSETQSNPSSSPQNSGGSTKPQAPPLPPTNANNNPPHIPLANFPSIKIVQPPRGRHSPKVDERCFTYCSQSIAGRLNKREPWCRSICIRRVFPHEVRNLIAFKNHPAAGRDGRAMYPLPPEGQGDGDTPSSSSSPTSETDPDLITTKSTSQNRSKPQRHWEEGYYLWLSKSRWAAQERMDLMSFDLDMQTQWMKEKEHRAKVRAEWEEVERTGGRIGGMKREDMMEGVLASSPSPRAPPPIVPDVTNQSLLLLLPPSMPTLTQPLLNLLAPTQKVLILLKESLNSGDQVKLAEKCWETAWTADPFRLASNACSRMWERWKEGPGDNAEG